MKREPIKDQRIGKFRIPFNKGHISSTVYLDLDCSEYYILIKSEKVFVKRIGIKSFIRRS